MTRTTVGIVEKTNDICWVSYPADAATQAKVVAKEVAKEAVEDAMKQKKAKK